MLLKDYLSEFVDEMKTALADKQYRNQYSGSDAPSPQKGWSSARQAEQNAASGKGSLPVLIGAPSPVGTTFPTPSPTDGGGEDPPKGWLKFSGYDLTPEDPRGPPIPVPFAGQPIQKIADALNTDPKYKDMHCFTTAGRTRGDPGSRGGWVRVRPKIVPLSPDTVVHPNGTVTGGPYKLVDTTALYVRESFHQDLIEIGILLWRIFYKTVLRFRLEHPDWLYIRYEDMVYHDRLGTFQQIMRYSGITYTNTIQNMLLAPSTKWPRGIDYFRYTFSSDEIAHINAGTRDVWPSFYSDADWYDNKSFWDAGLLSPAEIASREQAAADRKAKSDREAILSAAAEARKAQAEETRKEFERRQRAARVHSSALAQQQSKPQSLPPPRVGTPAPPPAAAAGAPGGPPISHQTAALLARMQGRPITRPPPQPPAPARPPLPRVNLEN